MLYYLKFHIKQKLCGEEHQYTESLFLFILEKAKPKKQKKNVNISYLIMVLTKIRLLIFLVLTQYGLACKYGIIFQILLYNWMQNCIF